MSDLEQRVQKLERQDRKPQSGLVSLATAVATYWRETSPLKALRRLGIWAVGAPLAASVMTMGPMGEVSASLISAFAPLLVVAYAVGLIYLLAAWVASLLRALSARVT